MSAPERPPGVLPRAVEKLREIAGVTVFSYIPLIAPVLAVPLADLLEAFTSCECDEDGDHWREKSAALRVARLVLGEPETEEVQP